MTELKLDLQLNMELGSVTACDRVQEAVAKKKKASYEPSWDEVWLTGYPTTTGKTKAGILQTKLTDKDKEKLLDIKRALESKEITAEVESLKKLTKSYLLNTVYKELRESRRAGIIARMIKNKPANYLLIDNDFAFVDFIKKAFKEKVIAVDTETTGVDIWGQDRIVGLSITLIEQDLHCYIPIRHNVSDYQLPADLVFARLHKLLECTEIRKVLHNVKFDAHMLYKEGIVLGGLLMDTMVAMHCLNENEPSYALKNIATKYGEKFGFNDKSDTYEELFGKGGFQDTPLDIATVYACKDTHLTAKLYKWIDSYFQKMSGVNNQYYNIELPLAEVCIKMERNGMLIDMQKAESYEKELGAQLSIMEQELNILFEGINVNSNTQLAELLFDKWGLIDISKSRKVNKEVLTVLAGDCEPLQKLLAYRKLTKLYSTYIQPLPQKVTADNRLHGEFNQSATYTGRFASKNPNMQNLPYDARKLFVAPAGKMIIGVDYSL